MAQWEASVCVCVCVLACELVVEIDYQRVVPPVKGRKQMKEAKEADLRRTERGRGIHSHDLLNEQSQVLFSFYFYFWKACTKTRLERRILQRKRPPIPWWSKRCRMQEKRRHQQVGRVLRHIVAEELRTQPALGQATHCAKTWVLLLKSRNKRGGEEVARAVVRNSKLDITLAVKSEKQDAVVTAGGQKPAHSSTGARWLTQAGSEQHKNRPGG